MWNYMVEKALNQAMVSLQAQLASILAAMNMHIRRAEELAVELETVQAEIAALETGRPDEA